jgi:hypothetical protein
MRVFITLFAFLLFSNSYLLALDYYWVGTTANGSGNYNDINSWKIGSVTGILPTQTPISNDNIFFPATSFLPGATVTVNSNANCANMTWDNSLTLAQTPLFTSATNVQLDIYGNMSLAQNMIFRLATFGNLSFKATAGLQTIQTRNVRVLLNNFEISCSASAEVRLLDDLYVDDISQSTNNSVQGSFLINSGHFNSNGRNMRFDFFSSANANISRRITWDNSTISVTGANTPDNGIANNYNLNFTNSPSLNYAGFSAIGSNLNFQATSGLGQFFYNFGTNLQYGNIILSVNNNFNRIWNSTSNCTRLELRKGITIINGSNTFLMPDILELGDAVQLYSLSASNINLTVNQIIGQTSCKQFGIIYRNPLGTGAFTLNAKNAGANVAISNIVLAGMSANTAGGKTYSATNSINHANSNAPVISFTATPTGSQQMRFKNNVALSANNFAWGNLNNWEEWNGTAYVPATCLPGLLDDVLFDNNSLASNQVLVLNQAAVCRNMLWTTVGSNANINFLSSLSIFGDLTLSLAMASTLNSSPVQPIMLFGTNSQTLISNGKIINTLRSSAYSDYTFADPAVIFNYTSSAFATIRSNGASFTMKNRWTIEGICTIVFNNTDVNIETSNTVGLLANNINLNFITATYSGTTTFHLRPPAGSAVTVSQFKMANVIAYDDVFFLNSVEIHGDFRAYKNANFQNIIGFPGQTTRIILTGTMPLYTGSMYLPAGYQATFNNLSNSYVSITGSFNAIGKCDSVISLLNAGTGNPATITVGSATNIDYNYIKGITKTGSTATANNSIDGLGNIGFTFPTASLSQTYYWRAKNGTAANTIAHFSGDWSDPTYWTTNPLSTTGQGLGGCLPTINDNVVFDNLSFLGASRTTISNAAFCNSITVTPAYAGIIQSSSVSNSLTIKQNIAFQKNVTGFIFNGDIFMIGTGSIQSSGTVFKTRDFVFDNLSGVWDLMDNFEINDGLVSVTQGVFRFTAGTLNTNNFNITLRNRFYSSSVQNRVLNLGSSLINMLGLGAYGPFGSGGVVAYTWVITNHINMVINAGTSRIVFASGLFQSAGKKYYMGDLSYNRVEFMETTQPSELYGNTNYNYALFAGSANIKGNNSFGTLELTGGYTWLIDANRTQTLASPNGTIIPRNVSLSAFININTNPSGSTSTIHKSYGTDICIDYIKVQDNIATKAATAPAPYDLTLSSLFFNTGSNSDNIGGTATGTWRFLLPALVVPNLPSALHNFCTINSGTVAPLALTGTSPYLVQGTWLDAMGGSGTVNYSFIDNDNNPATAFNTTMSLSSAFSTTYTLTASALRCGINYISPVSTIIVAQTAPNIIVNTNR